MAAPKTCPNRLRELRKAKDWTLQELADALTLSVSTVHRYETGERRLSVNDLARFADKLECEPSDILLDTDADERALLALFRQMSPPQRQQALRLFAGWIGSKKPRRRRASADAGKPLA